MDACLHAFYHLMAEGALRPREPPGPPTSEFEEALKRDPLVRAP